MLGPELELDEPELELGSCKHEKPGGMGAFAGRIATGRLGTGVKPTMGGHGANLPCNGALSWHVPRVIGIVARLFTKLYESGTPARRSKGRPTDSGTTG